MPSDEVAIKVENVKKTFRLPHHKSNMLKHSIIHAFKKKDKTVETFHALKGISFEVKKGEFFGILGRNGSGKSTLLKILAQIYQPSSGKVSHKGKLVPFIELGVGFKPELTGRENVYLNGALLGFSAQEIDERYDDIVQFAELEEFMDQKLKNYSSGMKVRLAFSVAIRADVDILLLDEVLAVGDAEFQRKCHEYFKTLKTNQKTIIFVSHNMNDVRKYCDRAILIEEGQIAHEGDASTVADEYTKLFSQKKQTAHAESSSRFGTQEVVIDEFELDVGQKAIVAKVVLKAGREAVSGVKFGLAIKTPAGRALAGVNTLKAVGGQPLDFEKNEKKRIKLSMPNILGSHDYVLGATIKAVSGPVVYDSWKEIARLNNPRDSVYYPVEYPAKVSVE